MDLVSIKLPTEVHGWADVVTTVDGVAANTVRSVGQGQRTRHSLQVTQKRIFGSKSPLSPAPYAETANYKLTD